MRIEVKLVVPHLPTVPADRAATGRLVFSFSLASESSGKANVGAAARFLFVQRDMTGKRVVLWGAVNEAVFFFYI